ncbi:29058_t:CDS:2 [Gigaspora margarita]|uniref:29058_t:CDS:1 n=1 Tax=Gigaspora margarita TaxID=4874 RepID=A0ABM8VVX0_GIGMA|nr:29058_t:CDS:2 [Gigaspora margarita]
MSTKNNLKAKEKLSREQEYQKLFAKAIKAYNKKEYKESYWLGVSKNPKEARNLLKEVSTSDSKYKEAAREQ